jgi:hypothetical protein
VKRRAADRSSRAEYSDTFTAARSGLCAVDDMVDRRLE